MVLKECLTLQEAVLTCAGRKVLVQHLYHMKAADNVHTAQDAHILCMLGAELLMQPEAGH